MQRLFCNSKIQVPEKLNGSLNKNRKQSKMQRRPHSVPNLPFPSAVTNQVSNSATTDSNGKSKSPKTQKKITTRQRPSSLTGIICRYILIILLLLVGLSSPFLYLVYSRLGLGSYFPKQSLANQQSVLPESVLEVVVTLPSPPGNVAVSSRNRIFFSFHPEYNPIIKVAELKNSSPDKQQYNAFPSMADQQSFQSILSLRIDQQDRLWLLDFAHHGIHGPPSLYAFDISKNNHDQMVKNYSFPRSVAGFGSMLNDFQVDPTGEFIFIADTSILGNTPSLIIYTISKDYSVRVLSSHFSMFGSSHFLNVTGQSLTSPLKEEPNIVKFGPLGLKIHVDSIALDRSGSRLYYGAMSSNTLYSVSTSHLLSYIKKVEQLNGSTPVMEESVHNYVRLVSSEKPITDGLSTDSQGNIWMTAVEHSALVLAVPYSPKDPLFNGVTDVQAVDLIKVVESKRLLRWPDGLCFGPDGLYITNSALHYKFLSKNITAYAPFHILKLPSKHLKNNKQLFKKKSFTLPAAGH